MNTIETQRPETFLQRWIVANAAAEFVGLGLSVAAGYLLFQQASTWIIFFGMITFGIFLEGIVVGWLQWIVLKTKLSGLTAQAWIGATAFGAGIAWTLGMLPSSLMDSVAAQDGDGAMAEPNALFLYVMALVMGAVLGPILGCAQAFVLRHHVNHPYRWLPANAVAWAVGMLVIFVGIDLALAASSPLVSILIAALTLLITGTSVGLLHGLFLVKMLP